MGKILDLLNAKFLIKKKIEGMTQEALGEKMGVEQSAVSQYLTGGTGISIDILEKFCDALEIKLTVLNKGNPELMEIQFHDDPEAEPPELAKEQKNLARLYRKNRPAYDIAVAVIKHGLKASRKTAGAQARQKPRKKEEEAAS